jgi:hypothetical protein
VSGPVDHIPNSPPHAPHETCDRNNSWALWHHFIVIRPGERRLVARIFRHEYIRNMLIFLESKMIVYYQQKFNFLPNQNLLYAFGFHYACYMLRPPSQSNFFAHCNTLRSSWPYELAYLHSHFLPWAGSHPFTLIPWLLNGYVLAVVSEWHVTESLYWSVLEQSLSVVRYSKSSVIRINCGGGVSRLLKQNIAVKEKK